MKRGRFNPVSVLMIIMGTIVLIAISGNSISHAQQVQGVSENSIKIGLFGPLTGSTALYGKGVHMDTAYYEEMVNKKGGIHGRKIDIIAEDTACDPIKGVAAVKKLIYQDKVFLLDGGRCSNVVLAAKKEIIESGIPYVVDGAASHMITSPFAKNIFTGVFTSVGVAKSMVDFAMSKPGVKKVALIKHTDEWGQSFHRPVLEQLKVKYGITPVADVTIEAGVSDATPQILEIKKANPDLLIAITYVIPTSTTLRDAYKLGLKIPIIGNPAINVLEQYNRVGIPDACKYFFAPHYFKEALDGPLMEKWRKVLEKYYPKDLWDANPGLSIGGAMAIEEALKRAGRNLTWGNFIEALESLNNFSPEDYPMASPIQYSATDHIGMDFVNFAVMMDGKLKVVKNWPDYEELLKKK